METRSVRSPVRIAFFHAYPQQYGGSQRLTHALAREFVDRGHEVTVVLTDEGPFAERLRADSVSVLLVPTPDEWRVYGRALERSGRGAALLSLPRYWRELGKAFRSLLPDVVHVNDHRGILLAGLAARSARRPVVWHLHAAYRSRSITLLGTVLARRIVVVSNATRDEQRGLPRRGRKVVVVHNGLIDGPIGPARRDSNASAGGHSANGLRNPLVVSAGRFHPDKGLDVLIRATPIMREADPGIRVIIAGAPQPGYESYRDELLSLVQDLALEDTVTFAGLVDDPMRLWNAADVYVQPSRRESFGLGVVEAMSVGTPVVTTAVGGMIETVVPERDGLQVAADDPEALANAISRVLHDDELASRLARCGRERASAFSMKQMADRLLEIYEQVGAGRLVGARS
jgi:glycosyltransferase involved in cell wall biosynthesis